MHVMVSLTVSCTITFHSSIVSEPKYSTWKTIFIPSNRSCLTMTSLSLKTTINSVSESKFKYRRYSCKNLMMNIALGLKMINKVMMLIAYILELSYVEAEEVCFPEPVFMKFHKVGSESVTLYLISVTEKLTKEWRGDYCNTTFPYAHEVLDLYMNHGLEGMIDECVITPEKFCRISLTTVIRNPLEKFLSYLYHFKSDILIRAHVNGNTIVRETMEMIFNRTSKLITVHHMSELVEHCRRWNIHQPLFFISRYFTESNYDTMYMNITNDVYEDAAYNIQQDFDAVGVTEWMPSYFVLLSKVYNYDIITACGLHLDHGSSKTYKNVYGVHARPSIETLFSPVVLRYLKEKVFDYDIKFWNYMKDIHSLQLKKFGLTVDEAHELYYAACQKV